MFCFGWRPRAPGRRRARRIVVSPLVVMSLAVLFLDRGGAAWAQDEPDLRLQETQLVRLLNEFGVEHELIGAPESGAILLVVHDPVGRELAEEILDSGRFDGADVRLIDLKTIRELSNESIDSLGLTGFVEARVTADTIVLRGEIDSHFDGAIKVAEQLLRQKLADAGLSGFLQVSSTVRLVDVPYILGTVTGAQPAAITVQGVRRKGEHVIGGYRILDVTPQRVLLKSDDGREVVRYKTSVP